MNKIFILVLLFTILACDKEKEIITDEITSIDLYGANITHTDLSLYLKNVYLEEYPVNFSKVKKVSAGRNKIETLGDLSFLPNLKSFNGGVNEIKTLENVNFSTKLTSLIFLNNDIEKITEIDDLINLETLWFRYNDIKKIEGLNTLVNLKYLDLSYNDIEVIEGLEDLESLERLEISVNKIKDYSGLLVLKKMKGINIIGKDHVQDEKSRKILLQVRENNPDADLLGFDWIDEDE